MEIFMIDISDFSDIASVMRFFEEITRIPRGSGNTDLIADYLYNFGKERSLETVRDEYNNVIIKKAATAGYEDRPALILQGHSDIVCEKEPWCETDMTKEGVEIYREGDFIKARGTTLGADDGIALAYALAILDSDTILHPRLECVFTTDEETGLAGAMNIDPSLISGRMMINLDSGDEGVFTVGCAGGARVDISLPVTRKAAAGGFYKLSVTGLLGGHSGVEIDKGRTNAVKAMLGLLFSLGDIEIASLYGGNADNAIPREAYAVFASETKPDEKALSELLSEICVGEEPVLTLESAEECKVIDDMSAVKLLSLVAAVPSGVYKMSEDIEGLVETSSNLGICSLSEESFNLTVSVRSSAEKEKEALIERIKEDAEVHGASVSVRGSYPGWAYKKDSALRGRMIESWRNVLGGEPEVIMIHAGLECGIFSDKLPSLDCVSTGPNHFDIHTPKERLSLSSTARVWKFLLDVLKNI